MTADFQVTTRKCVYKNNLIAVAYDIGSSQRAALVGVPPHPIVCSDALLFGSTCFIVQLHDDY